MEVEDIIKALEEKTITKKVACEELGLTTPAGNPQYKKLTEYLENYTVRKKADKKIRAKKRKEAFSDKEVAEMITMYLRGDSFTDLSEHFYRSVQVIKNRLEGVGALLRRTVSPDMTEYSCSNPPEFVQYENPLLLPEECVVDSHAEGSLVWSARYGQLAKIIKEVQPGVYRIFMSNEAQRKYAYQPAEELGFLGHLQELGVQFKLVTNDDY